MDGIVSYDDIGRVAFAYYKADIERFNAKHQRAAARTSHLCESEKDIGGGDIQPDPCWQYSHPEHFDDWCDNCKYVQPYHLAYTEAVKNARVMKYKLTHFCKRMLWNEGH